MDKFLSSKDSSHGHPRGEAASTGSATGDRFQSQLKEDGASIGSATGCRSLSQPKKNKKWQILIWVATGLFALFIVMIIIIANWGTLPFMIGMIYTYPMGDKLGHFILMGLLTFLVNLSLSAKKIRLFSRQILLGSVLVFSAVVFEEFSQLFVLSRSFSLLDLSFDFIGILCASWLITRLCSPKIKTTTPDC